MIYVATAIKVRGMETMGERLRAARERKFSSASKAAEAMGVSASTYRAHENGQNDFGPEEADLYAKKFGTSAGYLLTGKGPWHSSKGSEAKVVATYDPDDEAAPSYFRDNWKPNVKGSIPELDGKLGAGQGVAGDLIALPIGGQLYTGHRVVAEWLLPETFLRHEAKASSKSSVVMEVTGDSMLPSYLPGDRVIIDLGQSTLSVDSVYAISDGQSEPQIKRLQRVPFSNPVQVRIISDNTAFQMDTVDLSRLTIIGRVCGHIARR
jgi:phage repressor protein C with HTH and peptisase S24 domain